LKKMRDNRKSGNLEKQSSINGGHHHWEKNILKTKHCQTNTLARTSATFLEHHEQKWPANNQVTASANTGSVTWALWAARPAMDYPAELWRTGLHVRLFPYIWNQKSLWSRHQQLMRLLKQETSLALPSWKWREKSRMMLLARTTFLWSDRDNDPPIRDEWAI
jgi:hypothetical protein